MPEDFLEYPEYQVGSDTPYYTPDTATSQSDKSRVSREIPGADVPSQEGFRAVSTLIRVAPADLYKAGFGDLAAGVHVKKLGIPMDRTKSAYNALGLLFYRDGFEEVQLKDLLLRLPSSRDPNIRKQYLAILETMYELNLVDV